MQPITTRGHHTIFTIDTSIHKFREFFERVYATSQLSDLHLSSSTYKLHSNGEVSDISDYESDLHKQFYTEIKTHPEFKQLYCSLIQQIHSELFSEEKTLIYQSFPSVRFQFPNNIAVPPHCDSDALGKHPNNEKNFLLPITSMKGTQRLFIESEPKKGDFSGVDLEYGQLFYFNGNKCIHYNEKNIENTLRISLDFRIMKLDDYKQYIMNGNLTTTNPRDPEKARKATNMVIGGYYQVTKRGDDIPTMMKWHFQKDMIVQSRPHFDEQEAKATYAYMSDSNNYLTEFRQTERLENMFCEFMGAKHCIMTTSGNNAIIMALMALNLQPGSEVIVPNYTMIASINSIKMVGLKPVLADVDSETLTLSIKNIQDVLTERTKVVLHVSLNNRHKDILQIQGYCKDKGLFLVEDSAQSCGCRVNGQHFGTFGIMGCFSLSTPKIISTGQGGFVITNDDELARQLRMIKNFGRKEGGIDVFEVFGLNLKFTDVQAVIGIEQAKKLPQRVRRLREIFDLYASNLQDCSSIRMILPTSEEWIPWFVDIFVEDRERLMFFLKQHNIQTRPTYPEINKTPMYEDGQTFSVSEYVSRTGLFLPTHPILTNEEIEFICKILKLFTYR
jgi:perosamine synthetase